MSAIQWVLDMNVKWIKLSTDLFDNRKIKAIESLPDGDALIVIWLKLLVLAGNVNDGGYVYFTKDIPYTDQLLSTQFNRPLATVQVALKTFQQFGMIEIIDELICVSNWEKYQSADKLDKLREQGRKRVAEYRERKRLEQCNVTCNADVTQCNAAEKNKKEDIEEDKKRESVFNAPTIEEVQAYVKENGLKMDAAAFFDNYSASGWIDGNGNKIEDWKASCRKWARRERNNEKQGVFSSDASYDLDDFTTRAIGMRGSRHD